MGLRSGLEVQVINDSRPRQPKAIVVRKNRTTGRWVWACGSTRHLRCFRRWGANTNQLGALLDALSHYTTWHMKGRR